MENIYNKYGINVKSYPMFFNKKEDNRFDTRMKVIRAFTSTNYLYQLLYRIKGFSVKRINMDKMSLSYKNEYLEFSKLSDLLMGEETVKKELLNYKKRMGKCHHKSLEFLPSIEGRIVTGYVDDGSNKVRCIHSFIEDNNNVIDYTSNLVISKEDYYKLMNVEVLSVIEKEEYIKDCNSSFLKEFVGCKFYCLFRDELSKQGLMGFDKEKTYKK